MDRKGVSVLVGFILLMLTLMIFLSIMQAYMVPSMCKDAELKHLNTLAEDIQTLNRNIIDNKLTTVTLDLGISYPKYPMLLSPPTMASSVRTEKFTITISYDEILPNGSIEPQNIPLTSDRIVVMPNYFYDRGEEIMLENTAILRLKRVNNQDRFLFAISDQEMFTQSGVRITLINATFKSFSASQPVDIAIVPISYGGYVIARNITVSFNTECPKYWSEKKEQLESMGYNVSVSGNTVTIHYSNSTKLEISYALLFRGISIPALQYANVQRYENLLKPYRMIPTNPTTNYTLRVGESVVLGVKVLDRFNNPVRGVPINISLDGVGSVTPKLVYTDSNGCANAVFRSNSTGEATVNFSASCGFVIYKISITSAGVQFKFPYGVTYDANTPGAVFAFGNEVSSNPPTTNTTPAVPLLSITNITKDDGIYLVSEAIDIGYYAAQRFEFFGLNTTNVLETYVYWNGYGIGWWRGGESLYIWNYNTQSYDPVVTTYSPYEIWLGVGLNSTELQNYVKDGKMIVLIVQNGITVSNIYPSELYTDYIGVFQIFK